MAEFPALPLWTDAFMADTGHLSDAEVGLYARILMTMWRLPNCRLPNDDTWLAKRFGKTTAEVETQIRPLIREFCHNDGNWIIQKRLMREKTYVSKKWHKRSEMAKAFWEKKKAASVRNAPTPTPTPIEERDAIASPKKKDHAHDGSKRGTRLPADWQPDPEGIVFCLERGVDPNHALAEFRDYWTALPGAKGTKLDWQATFRNRVRQLAEKTKIQRSGPATGIVAGFADALRRREEEDRGRDQPFAWPLLERG